MPGHPDSVEVLGYALSSVDWGGALRVVEEWAAGHQSRYVCLCNTHVVMTARSNRHLDRAIRDADLTLPDGMPIAVLMRLARRRHQPRLAGPDLMWRYCARADQSGQSIFLLGATTQTLERLNLRLKQAFPDLRVVGCHSPAFGAVSAEEDRQIVERINRSGAQVVFVALGCPKQEIWMHEHRGLIRAVMLGVGAAFDFHAGVVPRAPVWMQRTGMEWLHRLITEPKRLWRRYLVTNIQFLAAIVWGALAAKLHVKE